MTGLVDSILGIIGTIIYPLFGVIYSVIDLVERIFQAFAGTETVYVSGDQVTSDNTGADADTGIVYYLLQSDLVRNMFLAMLYLAIILLVVFTIMAVLKNMYQPQPKKWQDIIASAIKGLGLFIIVPACSLLAVWVGNILLVAIDGATSGSNSSATMSGRLFIAASYTSNYIRSDAKGIDLQKHNEVAALCDRCGIEIRAFQPTDGGLDTDYEYYASLVDDCFASEAMSAARCNWGDVNAHYAIIHINFLTLAAGGIFMLYVLGSISFGMVKRLFMLVILFIISPVVCSMYPIDEGNAYKSWFGEFKKNLLSAYGAVAGMNLFLSIMPIIDTITLGGDWSWSGGDWVGLLQLILVIAGLFVVKDVISFISGLAGGDNSYSGGNTLFASVRGKAKSGLGKIGSGAKKLRHGGSMAYQASKAAKAAGGSGTAAFFRQAGASVLSSLNSGLSKTTGLDFSGIVKGGATKEEKDRLKDLAEFNRQTQIRTGRLQTDENNNVIGHKSARATEYKAYRRSPIDKDGNARYGKKMDDKEYQELADKLGLTDGAKKDVAKARGQKSYDDYLSNIDNDRGLAKAIDSAQDRYNRAADERNTLVGQLNNGMKLNINGADVNITGKLLQELRNRALNNRKYADDETSEQAIYQKKIDNLSKQGYPISSDVEKQMRVAARAEAARNSAFNNTIDRFQANKLEVQNANDALREAKENALENQKLGTFTFSKDSIKELADQNAQALAQNNAVQKSDIASQTQVLKDLKDSIKGEVIKTLQTESKKLIKAVESTKKKDDKK